MAREEREKHLQLPLLATTWEWMGPRAALKDNEANQKMVDKQERKSEREQGL